MLLCHILDTMRWALLALLLTSTVSLFAERKVTSISPNAGLTFGTTHVLIRGSELVPQFVQCDDACLNPSPCSVTVLIGTAQARVLEADPAFIRLEVPARAESTADVTVRVEGREDIVIANGFRFDSSVMVGEEDYDRYLVPVLGHEVPGANSSLWTTELTVHNALPQTRVVLRAPTCDPRLPVICPDTRIEPSESKSLRVYESGIGVAAAFLYAPKAVADALPMELRVRDLSRENEGWGTEIPVVRLSDYAVSQHLLDVPADPRYRATLRIYGPGEWPLEVRVRVFPTNGDEAIEDQQIMLHGISSVLPIEFPLHPAYAQLDPLTSKVRASGHPTVRVEVSTDPPVTIWAFISITNNETQQVTAITPH